MIEVRIAWSRIRRFDNDVHIAVLVLKELRDAGIPVRGSISVLGVDSGTLSVTDDDVFEEQVWAWR